jgi:hypothetical protein
VNELQLLGDSVSADQSVIYERIVREGTGGRSWKLYLAENRGEKEILHAVQGTLEPQQFRRLKQIIIQAKGIDAFFESEVRRQLNLTAAQLGRIAAVARKAEPHKPDRGVLRSPFGEPELVWLPLRTQFVRLAMQVLDKRQKALWQSLAGKPLTLAASASQGEMADVPAPNATYPQPPSRSLPQPVPGRKSPR